MFSPKKLFMTVDTPITAFTSGDQVRINVTYNNESDYQVETTKVELIKIDESRVKNYVDRGSHYMETALFEGVAGNSMKTISTEFEVPDLIPSSDGVCTIVNISYEVHVTAVIINALNHTIKIPVFIF